MLRVPALQARLRSRLGRLPSSLKKKADLIEALLLSQEVHSLFSADSSVTSARTLSCVAPCCYVFTLGPSTKVSREEKDSGSCSNRYEEGWGEKSIFLLSTLTALILRKKRPQQEH